MVSGIISTYVLKFVQGMENNFFIYNANLKIFFQILHVFGLKRESLKIEGGFFVSPTRFLIEKGVFKGSIGSISHIW